MQESGRTRLAQQAPRVLPIPAPPQRVRLFNREFSWLDFNRRVLAEAREPAVPLLERLKFLSICAANLDEFLMVRLGVIRELAASKVTDPSADGLTPKQQLKGLRHRVKNQIGEIYACEWELRKELARSGITIESPATLSKKERARVSAYFSGNVAPILTPLAVDRGHPFPFLASRALNVAVVLAGAEGERHVALLQLSPLLPRFIPLDDDATRFLPLEGAVELNAPHFFPGLKVDRTIPFRVLRNADLSLQEDEVQDLLKSVESELRRRDRKEVVWVEVAGEDAQVTGMLSEELGVGRDDIYHAPDLLRLSDLMEIHGIKARGALKDPPFNPRIPPQLATSEDIFSILRRGDLLLHRPYDSFIPVVELIQSAAVDDDVAAIKITLYRTDAGSAIVDALVQAAKARKQVTVIVELQARFDEMKNIQWARRLEEEGVQVVYGLVGVKTHCKVALIVRREGDVLRRYVHLSTGNYNAVTARIYTDIDLFTTDEAFGEDASQLMNLLTGYSIASAQEILEGNAPSWKWRAFVVAPMDYRDWVISRIAREAANAREGKPAGIVAKMNSLVDPTVIEALYAASQAGVKIDLIVRGICCLVPGVPGLSDHIRVISIIDRFLEHSRIALFRNGGLTEIHVASGDWMPRNFHRRIEVAYPILSERLRARIEEQILAISLSDDTKAWKLHPDGTWTRKRAADAKLRSQERFIELARAEAVRVAPQDAASAGKPGAYRRKARRKKEKK